MSSPQTTPVQFSDPAIPSPNGWTSDLPASPPQTASVPPYVPLPGQTPVVTPETDSRLDQLTAEFARLKPEVDEKTTRLKEITDAIKQEVWTAGATEASREVLLRSPHLPSAYRVHPQESYRIDSTRMKKESPETYAYWARKSLSWRLDPVK